MAVVAMLKAGEVAGTIPEKPVVPKTAVLEFEPFKIKLQSIPNCSPSERVTSMIFASTRTWRLMTFRTTSRYCSTFSRFLFVAVQHL